MAIPFIISATTGISSISPRDTTRDSIYIAAMPLRAKGPAQMLMSLTYSFNVWDLQHYMVIIKPSIASPQPQAFVFDFQPQDPEDIYVALAALSGNKVPGAVLVRKLTKLPKKKCWLVGFSSVGCISKANSFNELWDTNLRIGQHDCRNYTNGLVEYLTGEKHVLERLRGTEEAYRVNSSSQNIIYLGRTYHCYFKVYMIVLMLVYISFSPSINYHQYAHVFHGLSFGSHA